MPETQIEKLRFARRHLYLLASVGIAAMLTRTKAAKAFTCTTASAVTPSNPQGLNPTFAGDPDCETIELGLGGGSPRPQCFLKGTKILTKAGERPIEDLVPGDWVLARNKGFHPVEDIIRLEMGGSAGADCPLGARRRGANVNIDVSKATGHLLVNGALITAASLVNGRTITYAQDVAETAYFHIELDHHGIVYAHGAPCESYVEDGAELSLPVLGQGGGLSKIKSHLRSALLPESIGELGDRIGDELDH